MMVFNQCGVFIVGYFGPEQMVVLIGEGENDGQDGNYREPNQFFAGQFQPALRKVDSKYGENEWQECSAKVGHFTPEDFDVE